jgi:hypothetical protein
MKKAPDLFFAKYESIVPYIRGDFHRKGGKGGNNIVFWRGRKSI